MDSTISLFGVFEQLNNGLPILPNLFFLQKFHTVACEPTVMTEGNKCYRRFLYYLPIAGGTVMRKLHFSATEISRTKIENLI